MNVHSNSIIILQMAQYIHEIHARKLMSSTLGKLRKRLLKKLGRYLASRSLYLSETSCVLSLDYPPRTLTARRLSSK